MKRRPRIQPDPDRIVVVTAQGAAPLAIARSASGIRCQGEWTAEPEGTRPPAASIAVLETGAVLCRTVSLPEAEPSQLETALRLQVDAQQLGALPSWRTTCLVLPTPVNGGRIGLCLEWPESSATPATPRDLPPDGDPTFAADAACLAVLLEQGAQGPLVSVAADRSCMSFAFRVAGSAVIRCSRLDPSEWPTCAETTVLESALRAGADADAMRRLLASLREAIAHASQGGFGCTESDRRALSTRVEDAGDAEWWHANGLAIAIGLAWFGGLRPLLALRARPAGERPTRVGEFLNRIAEPAVASRLVVAALLALALAPPIVTGTRLLMLRWKVGDLAAREQAIQAHRQRLALYGQLQQRAWPMGKLLGDLACVTPEGVDWDDINLQQDRNVTIRGSARPQDGLSGSEVILKMERQMRDSRIFDKVQKKWDAPDSKGSVAFTMSAAVLRPTLRPSYPIAQDFGRKTLAERRYGPEKPDEPETDAPTGPPDASTLPETPSLANAGGDSPAVAASDPPHDDAAPKPTAPAPKASGKRPSPVVSNKPSSKSAPRTPAKPAGDSADGQQDQASAAGEDPAADAGSKAGRGARRAGAGGTPGLARRSERTPGSSDTEFKAPPPLSDADIAAMSREEALAAVSKVSEARQRVPTDDEETRKRLKSEFDKLMAKIRSGGGK